MLTGYVIFRDRQLAATAMSFQQARRFADELVAAEARAGRTGRVLRADLAGNIVTLTEEG